MEKQVQDWLEQAQADLKTTKDMITTQNYYAAVSFAQQCAEKALKALYIFTKKKLPPKLHDLAELARLVGAPDNILPQSEKLSVTYLSSRYPGTAPDIPARFYTLLKAQVHLQEAEVILEWARKRIK